MAIFLGRHTLIRKLKCHTAAFKISSHKESDESCSPLISDEQSAFGIMIFVSPGSLDKKSTGFFNWILDYQRKKNSLAYTSL